MAYEVVTARFRTELHARWSVFFDDLGVPYAYEPERFRCADGSVCTPAFWLPRERIWFAPEQSAPPWWAAFVIAASPSGCCEEVWDGSWDDEEPAREYPPVEVGEQWRGMTLLCLGGIPNGHGLDPWPGHGPHDLGCYTEGDYPYRWTLCPECGSFGATFFGYAEQLPCRCLDDRVHKIDNSADGRLMTAYRAASQERLVSVEPGPAGRTALVSQEGTALAAERCTLQCRSVGEQLRRELPQGAYADVTEDADHLCGECPGFVCTPCGVRPAPAVGAACRVCEPVALLTHDRARQILNDKAGEAGHAGQRSAREINTLLNRQTNAQRRGLATTEQLAQALTLAERWIADPPLIPPGTSRRPALCDEELDRLHGKELRHELSQLVGPLAAATGESFALVQLRLNYVMGVEERSEASDEQLREGIRQSQEWVQDPASYREHVRAAEAEVEPGGMPAPMRTRPARADSVCNLCTSPVTAGELIGRLHVPRMRRLASTGWLCAHCLYDRRAKPRPLDVLLRVFHHTFSGDGVRLNAAEAEVLLRWLVESPPLPEGDQEAVQEAFVALQHAIDTQETSLLLRYHPAHTVVSALHHSVDPTAADTQAVVLNAVAQHLVEWRENPQRLDPDHYSSRLQWRRAVLEQTARPTVLSQRGGPFFV